MLHSKYTSHNKNNNPKNVVSSPTNKIKTNVSPKNHLSPFTKLPITSTNLKAQAKV